VPDDDVRAGTAVDPHAGPALDGGHRPAEDVVALDHLDGQAGAGQVAGRDQPVVPGTDDDGVDGPVGRPARSAARHRLQRQPGAEDGERPGVPGEWWPRARSTKPSAW
jgi:hypothetical protein